MLARERRAELGVGMGRMEHPDSLGRAWRTTAIDHAVIKVIDPRAHYHSLTGIDRTISYKCSEFPAASYLEFEAGFLPTTAL